MEQRKEIINLYVQKGLRVVKAVKIGGISKSTFYYQPTGTKRGKVASKVTLLKNRPVPNEQVVEQIKQILSEEFIDYGYPRTTQALRDLGFVINKKKTYRLMAENGLLQQQIKRSKGTKRSFVQFTTPKYSHPFATIEIDIKFVYLHEEARNFYLITALDTFTRIALSWKFDQTMTKTHVASLVKSIKEHELLVRYKDIKIKIRTDNGPQFIAQLLAEYLQSVGIDHEFIHPGTPQQNGHIEAFHSTFQRVVADQYELGRYEDALQILEGFYHTYNNRRIMNAIANYSPIQFLKAWENGSIGIKVKNRKQIFFRERQVIEDDAALSREDSIGCIKINQKKKNDYIRTVK